MTNKNIVLGVSGGIAAYKSAALASHLVKSGYSVDVIMTSSAQEFIKPLTFETLTKRSVVSDMFDRPSHVEVEHISLAEKADMILVAPATYNIIGKVSAGIADDMLTTVISATKAPVVFALAMNSNMYDNEILQENIQKLKKKGYLFIDADEGRLACDTTGKGRMKEPVDIVNYVNDFFHTSTELAGKRVLVSAGRTEEAIDPIRYISNKSTGKMGYAIAEAAMKMGGDVTIVAGPVSLPDIKGIKTIKVKSALEMHQEIVSIYDSFDIVIMTAAVADYRIKNYTDKKIKKGDGDLVLELTRNPDILRELGVQKKKQFLVGFAAESENLIENALEKLDKKNLDMIVANEVGNFEIDTNRVYMIDSDKNISEPISMSKRELGFTICKEILKGIEKKDKK